ncbi:EamA family transporter [Mangrovivirga sp. M17]|uniref:EamA family transporter n=1 Tax=Mangrovivirga halotolerans TaxID=2993936 RepID=A0ABT3RND7_9BACT|nr:EamA family transporter [Mangrovivirga halotolerans]MCX2742858.1 EamA family transporter [Mangrovivirga halotolerans]
MLYLIIVIFLNVYIFVCFKEFGKRNITLLPALTINYITCGIVGLILSVDSIKTINVVDSDWSYFALGLGFIFIFTFFLMAAATQKTGVAAAGMATKISLVIPAFFSLYVFKYQGSDPNFFKISGIILGICSIVLVSLSRKKQNQKVVNKWVYLLPVGVFLFSGGLDTSLNYANRFLLAESEQKIFPVVIFFSAGIFGLIGSLIKKQKFDFKTIAGGVLLGIPNYFSIYLLLKALSSFGNDGSFVFPFINISIIGLSAIVGKFFYDEVISLKKAVGIAMSVIAILLLSIGN